MNTFTEILKELLEKGDKSQTKICEEMKIKKQKLSHWKTGYVEPNIDDLISLAKYFDVSIDYLVGYTDIDGKRLIQLGIA